MKLSGNEVYCANALLLLIEIMLFSKLCCQTVFKLKPFSYEARPAPSRCQTVWESGTLRAVHVVTLVAGD